MNTMLRGLSLCLMVLFLLLSACKRDDHNALTIIDTNFQENVVDLKQNLVFYFNHDIHPDSLLHQWDSTQYLSFEPQVEGLFKWHANNQVVFSPRDGFQPNTSYNVRIEKELLQFAESKLFLSKDLELSYHTPKLKLISAQPYWKKSPELSVFLNLDLNFNYEILPEDVEDHLNIEVGGKKRRANRLSDAPSKQISFAIQNSTLAEESQNVKITLTKGLGKDLGNISFEKDLSISTLIAAQEVLSINNVTSQHNGTEGVVNVVSSQSVKVANLKNYIEIEPRLQSYDLQASLNGFQLSSEEFRVGEQYQIRISKDLQGEFGGKMEKSYEKSFSFGALKPNIEFVNSKGKYLSGKGLKNLAINLTNIEKVKVTISKVYANNIMAFLREGDDYGWHDEYEDGRWHYYNYNYYNTSRFGDKIWEQEYEVGKLKGKKNQKLINLNFEDKVGDFEGIYVVQVDDPERVWLSSSRIVSVSDIGLISKRTKNNILVFANSIHNAEAMSGVEVDFISTNNQKVFSATTNSNGLAILPNLKEYEPFELGMICARDGNDFNYLQFSETDINNSRFEVGGLRSNDAEIDAYTYGERNLYRPGERIHLNTILRNKQWHQPPTAPYKVNLVMPNGRVAKSLRKSPDQQGSFNSHFDLPREAVTGTYRAEILSANDVLISTYPISVEEFMPDRIRVNTSLKKDVVETGDELLLDINAMNLFGPPAADRSYEVATEIWRKTHKPKGFEEYNFQVQGKNYFNIYPIEGQTDGEGNAEVKIKVPENYKNLGLLDGKITTTVFDETGRPVSRTNGFTVHTQPFYYGIKNFDRYVSTKSTLRIPLIALNREDKVMRNVSARVKVIRWEWQSVLERTRGRYRYRSNRKRILVKDELIKLDGSENIYSINPKYSGSYEIRIMRPDDTADYVQNNFYAYGYGDTENNSFEVNNEGQIDITLDKEEYEVGDRVRALLKLPFEGKVLVSLERDEVFEHFYKESDKKSLEISFRLKDEHVPNIYISATLIRPNKGKQIPLTVAHGFQPINVISKNAKLDVAIEAPEKSRSNRKQSIRVKTKPNAAVTLAVVDEGILQIKNFKSPDPGAFFYQKRALEVISSDIYAYLFPEISPLSFLTGGGDGDMSMMKDGANRNNPVQADRVKLTSYWSGTLYTNSKGFAEIEIDVPQFSGELRVMAVAYKDEAFGSAEQSVTIADPIVLSMGLPRFLNIGDAIEIPVTVSNTTEKAADGTFALSATGPISLIGETQGRISVEPNREKRILLRAKANEGFGLAQFNFETKMLGETFKQDIEISVRASSPLQVQTFAGIIRGGNSEKINFSDGLFPGTGSSVLTISRSPMVEFMDDLEYLVRYPHGCLEQTVSKAFPQIYFTDLVKELKGDQDYDPNPNRNVQAAINKLEALQSYNGGLIYWPGNRSDVHWFGTVYASHFMLEAKKAGFDVNEKVLTQMLDFLRAKLRDKQTVTYRYNGGAERIIAAKEACYSLYVLAMAGRPYNSIMNFYKQNQQLLSLDSKYLLACAYGLSGDRQRFNQVLPSSFEGEESETQFGGSFYSATRDQAIALNALLEVDPNSPQIPKMVRYVTQQLKVKRWLSTQERVWAFLALGKFTRQNRPGSANATVTAGNSTIDKFSGKTLTLTDKEMGQGEVRINAEGEGSVFFHWTMKGMPVDGSFEEKDEFLKVRRRYFTRSGRPIDNNRVEQNDLVVVELTVQGPAKSNIENVAITDCLPAGLEIENPRLESSPSLDWIKARFTPDHMDIRDDRIHLFTTVTQTSKSFYYMCRAVSKGEFQMGPVAAEAMYNPEYHSIFGRGLFVVE